MIPLPPPPPGVTVAWINQSTNDLPMAAAARIVEALNVQAADVAAAWPDKPRPVHGLVADPHSVPAGAIPAYWLPSSDVAGALGYHDVDPQGRPYVRVFTRPTLENGGAVLEGPNSIAVTSTHEGPEEEVDPSCNWTVRGPDGRTYAVEDCDAVEAFAYDVTLADGSRVSVSDILFPAFFGMPNPPGVIGLDKMGKAPAPFETAPGGYQIVDGQAVFAAGYPEWKKAAKQFPAARTYRRLHAEA